MLESFTVRNFRSIKEATLSLTFAERRAPAGFRTMENIPFVQVGKTPRDRLVTAMALYGPNGCGKSALIRAATRCGTPCSTVGTRTATNPTCS